MHVQQGELRWFCDCMVRPQRARGKEGNWVQTMPGKGWNVLLRLDGPLQPFWFDKTWKPGDFEEVK